MTGALLLVLLGLLSIHAVGTHGVVFALIWLGLTSGLAGLRDAFLGRPVEPQHVLLSGCALYLAALFAKGFVERTRWRGRVVPFALAAAACALAVAAPLAFLQERPVGADVTDGALAAFLFAASYRLVSLRTQDDPRKLIVLGLAAPVLAGLAGLAARLVP